MSNNSNLNLIEKTLKYRGEESPVYFRELTGEQTLQLSAGQKAQHTQHAGDAATVTMEVDMGERLENNYRLTFFTLVTAEGKQAYQSWGQFVKEKGSKLKALQKLAAEAQREFDALDEESGPGKE